MDERASGCPCSPAASLSPSISSRPDIAALPRRQIDLYPPLGTRVGPSPSPSPSPSVCHGHKQGPARGRRLPPPPRAPRRAGTAATASATRQPATSTPSPSASPWCPGPACPRGHPDPDGPRAWDTERAGWPEPQRATRVPPCPSARSCATHPTGEWGVLHGVRVVGGCERGSWAKGGSQRVLLPPQPCCEHVCSPLTVPCSRSVLTAQRAPQGSHCVPCPSPCPTQVPLCPCPLAAPHTAPTVSPAPCHAPHGFRCAHSSLHPTWVPLHPHPFAVPFMYPTVSLSPRCAPQRCHCTPISLLGPTWVPLGPHPFILPHTGPLAPCCAPQQPHCAHPSLCPTRATL